MTTASNANTSMEHNLAHLFSEDLDIDWSKCDGESLMEVNPEQEIAHQLTVTGSVEDESGIQAQSSAQEKPRVSRAELVRVLEGFVQLVKNGDELDFDDDQLSFAPPKVDKIEFTVSDTTSEVAELKSLLVEAQGTIIRLLTDRVDDRARLSSMQSEIRLLPDLKAQAERAMQIAFTAEEFKAEFAKVKLEVERIKLARLRGEVETARHPWWKRFTDWMTQSETRAD